MNRIAVISFTKKGAELNKILCQELILKDTSLIGYGVEKYNDVKNSTDKQYSFDVLDTKSLHVHEPHIIELHSRELHSFISIHQLMENLMTEGDPFQPEEENKSMGKLVGIIFIGACGIAVRAIAPYIRHKAKDPAVVVVDEGGEYAISLLSGHLGGANELTGKIASCIGAVPVITTATDNRRVFAVDSFAMKNSLYITDTAKIKEISGAILNGERIGIHSEYPMSGQLPEGLTCEKQDKGISISAAVIDAPFPLTMHLLPKNLVVGIGCKKGVKEEIMYQRLLNLFSQHGLNMGRISKLCSIDIKKEEPGILKLVKKLEVSLVTYTAQELKQVSGTFTPSAFVESTVGVDNVCERSAALGSQYGKQLISKNSGEGMTLSVYEQEYQINF